MVRCAELLDARHDPLFLRRVLLDHVVRVEVEVPEFELRLGGRADGREHDVTSAWGPSDGVRRAARKRTCGGLQRRRPPKRCQNVTHAGA